MPKHNVTLPKIVSVRFTEAEFNRLVHLSRTNRRTVSQTVRLLVSTGPWHHTLGPDGSTVDWQLADHAVLDNSY